VPTSVTAFVPEVWLVFCREL